MSSPAPFIAAVVATFRRPAELRRLLESLQQNGPELGAVVVADNAADPELRANFPPGLNVEWLPLPENLGCGGGLARGGEYALSKFGAALTHVLFLDDDAVLPAGALALLLAALDRAEADVACPITINRDGAIDFHPGLLDRRKRRAIRTASTPEIFLAECGPKPVAFDWTTGVCLLVTRRAVLACGWHRRDYWLRGEDLEFSSRLTAKFRGIFVPPAAVRHSPPPAVHDERWRRAEFRRHCALVQNTTFSATHLAHCRTLLRSLPGTYRRFFAEWGYSWRTLAAAGRLLFAGAIKGQPAGVRLAVSENA